MILICEPTARITSSASCSSFLLKKLNILTWHFLSLTRWVSSGNMHVFGLNCIASHHFWSIEAASKVSRKFDRALCFTACHRCALQQLRALCDVARFQDKSVCTLYRLCGCNASSLRHCIEATVRRRFRGNSIYCNPRCFSRGITQEQHTFHDWFPAGAWWLHCHCPSSVSIHIAMRRT